ncbi:alpha,alpha-phosphotrehalase [Clostridium sp. AM58-1XD]|uniref:alpha,alpha-phosphotrehalase n=1 Tax=Clostridium sp. AM58-1XD TaxID=2292307 RepID=UPI000E493923|nr:alpha,alpha-phosphotrehalase [Clostridium sp. AM58-1XD]RGY98764.1 alpha,alpha-phosphotrehalase [Clostridium sp. AM58-1XD]
MKDFKKSTVYQIYPKSFKDTTGNGVGDIRGITEKLDYLEQLGVDYIWSTPFFLSPQNDNGYDVADYYGIEPSYGTMEDVEELIAEGKKRGIGLMLDMVFNHTSTEHEWFKKAMEGDPYYKDFYIFRKGENGLPPTNWTSKFGGSAWEYTEETGEYYLHLFDRTQADLNWDNPNVRRELVNVLKFWIEKGVEGFRFDVVNLISKPGIFTDDEEGDGRRFYTDGPHVHEYLNEMCRESGIWEKGLVTVGEMSSTTMDNCIRYSRPSSRELSMCFNFHHLKVDYKNKDKWQLQEFDFAELKSLLHGWQKGMENGDGWSAVFWNNHDQPRALSRFGDDEKYPLESAAMLAMTIHLMRGTPYIYQGEEIGMTNAGFTEIGQYRDVESVNYFTILKEKGIDKEEIYHILRERSRDNSRTPMQWDESKNAGFSDYTPWISVNKNFSEINVRNCLQDRGSVWYYYKRLVELRKQYDVIAYGGYTPLQEDHDSVFAFKRTYRGQTLLVFSNFYGTEAEMTIEESGLEEYNCLLTNYQERKLANKFSLQPYESVAFLREE